MAGGFVTDGSSHGRCASVSHWTVWSSRGDLAFSFAAFNALLGRGYRRETSPMVLGGTLPGSVLLDAAVVFGGSISSNKKLLSLRNAVAADVDKSV